MRQRYIFLRLLSFKQKIDPGPTTPNIRARDAFYYAARSDNAVETTKALRMSYSELVAREERIKQKEQERELDDRSPWEPRYAGPCVMM